MIIERAALKDALEILALQKLAFQGEAELHQDYSIPPLNQTLDETIQEFHDQIVLKASIDGRIVGSVRAFAENSTCVIGKLIVHPEHQNQGIGTRLLNEIEALFKDSNRFELFTGYKSERSLYLYRKFGYNEFSRKVVSEKLTLIFLEKTV